MIIINLSSCNVSKLSTVTTRNYKLIITIANDYVLDVYVNNIVVFLTILVYYAK